MMDKHINLHGKSSLKHLKYFTKPNDDKFSQFFSEPSSHEATPKSGKSGRLEPINQTVLIKKSFFEAPTTPKQSTDRRPNKPGQHESAKQIPLPMKTWLSAMDGELTPQDDKKKPKFKLPLSPASGSQKSNRTLSGTGGFTEHLSQFHMGSYSAKNSIISEPSEASSRGDSKQKMVTNNTPSTSYKISRRKILETGVVISRNKGDEAMSDNEFNRNFVNIKNDVHAALPYRHLIFGPLIDLDPFKKHLIMMHKGLIYATRNLKTPSERFVATRQVSLPKPIIPKTKTLLLDLDETLIHSCLMRDSPDVILTYQGLGQETPKQLPIKVRPYLKEFLSALSPFYEIIIFTASASLYARTIVNYIDKDKKHIHAILSREHCMETKNGFYIKDLRIIKERELKDMIIVDNLVHSFGFQVENGVPILEFINDKKDEELKYLKDYLLEAYKHDDLRVYNKKMLKLHEMASKNTEEIFSHIANF